MAGRAPLAGAPEVGWRYELTTSDRRMLVRLRSTNFTALVLRTTHDRNSESAVIKAEYGSIANFLAAHGYGPGAKKAKDAVPKATGA